MKYRQPKIGETVYCWVRGDKYISANHMLFLGPDKQAKDKLLVASKTSGWEIINLSDLPNNEYRSLGRCNIQEELLNKKTKKVEGYIFQLYDKKTPVLIEVKLFRGIWKIKSKFEMPSWTKVKDPK